MEGQNENDELYPIAVLIDELKVHEIPLLQVVVANIGAHISYPIAR
jgi:hypothetical protein